MKKPLILVVEDDKAIRNLISMALDMQGYNYHTAETGSASLLEAMSSRPDIIILDLGLPDMDGIDIIKKVRSWSTVPIIVVSARGEDRDKVLALDAGADDYLTKPFSVDELLARLRVTLRRTNQAGSTAGADLTIFTNGALTIDYSAGCAFMNKVEIHLTPIEYKLLCLLAKNAGKVLTHNFILKEIWATATLDDTPSLRVFMATLRKKIDNASASTSPKSSYIQTHIGVGYRMVRLQDAQDMQDAQNPVTI